MVMPLFDTLFRAIQEHGSPEPGNNSAEASMYNMGDERSAVALYMGGSEELPYHWTIE